MNKISLIIFMVCLTVSVNSYAFTYTYGQAINRLYVQENGYVSFGVSNMPTDTCDFFGFHFTFDTKTDAGKSKLSLLLSAKMSDKSIQIWYDPSTTPGTDNTNGCTNTSVATVVHIGVE